ncbi:MAG: UDP-N-acetylglucosamine 2-epimerase [Alphaproteobacteria bacterium]
MKRRICVVITARPSYARIKTVLQAIKDHPDLELQLVVGASALLDRYGSAIDVIRADAFEPDAEVYMVVEGENLVTSAKSTGIGISELATTFNNLRPDAVLTVADRYETIATAIAGSFMNIPVVHVQGGEVTGSIDEKVRHAVTKLADLHMAANENAAERLLRMGERRDRVFVTGCPSIDLAVRVRETGGFLKRADLTHGVGAVLDPHEDYIIVIQHPVTYEWKDTGRQFTETLEAVTHIALPTYWFWPNVDAGSDDGSRAIRKFRERDGVQNIHFLKNLPPEEFLELLLHARAIVGNSSAGIREAAFFGTPAVNIGSRQRGRECGPNVMHVSYETEAIVAAVDKQLVHGRHESSDIFGDGRAGERIAGYLATVELSVEKQITY